MKVILKQGQSFQLQRKIFWKKKMGAYGPLELLENLCVSQKDFVLLNFGPEIQRTGELEVQTEKKKKKNNLRTLEIAASIISVQTRSYSQEFQ